MVGGCGFVVAAGLGAWAAEECCLRGHPCDCLGNSSVGYPVGVFGYKYCGLLRSSTNNKIRVCGWCKFGLFVVVVFFLFFFVFFWFCFLVRGYGFQ